MNPFRFGALAAQSAFVNRERELKALAADLRNGQDVVLLAPRRLGKSSLVQRAVEQVESDGVLVAQVDLTRTPNVVTFAGALARAIDDVIASTLLRTRDRLRVFSSLRVRPSLTVDPDDGSMTFSFDLTRAPEADIDATLERLFALPGDLARERGRSAAVIFDEFQEVTVLDPRLPRLMRSVFQTQPEVAHVYLGSRRHLMRRLFSDENEPFWRSAKHVQLASIPVEHWVDPLRDRFAQSGKRIDDSGIDRLLAITGGHPYATQALAHFTWSRAAGRPVGRDVVDAALDDVLSSEDAHFTLLWERASATQRVLLQALAREHGRPTSTSYRARHALPTPSTVQKALEVLEREELVGRRDGLARIVEPFLAEWLERERR